MAVKQPIQATLTVISVTPAKADGKSHRVSFKDPDDPYGDPFFAYANKADFPASEFVPGDDGPGKCEWVPRPEDGKPDGGFWALRAWKGLSEAPRGQKGGFGGGKAWQPKPANEIAVDAFKSCASCAVHMVPAMVTAGAFNKGDGKDAEIDQKAIQAFLKATMATIAESAMDLVPKMKERVA